MNIKDLKLAIQNHTLNDNLLIFKNLSNNNWLINQYINEIAKIKNKQLFYLNSIDEYSSIVNDYLYILEMKELNNQEYSIYKDNYKNLIILCNKIENEKDIFNLIVFPKLELWQIKDYLQIKISGLNNTDLDYIFNLTKDDIYLLDNEIKKLNIFKPVDQSLVFSLLKKENNYKENALLFDLTNSIIKKDINGISKYLTNNSNIDPIALNSILIKQFKNIIKVQMKSKSTTYEQLNMEYKQFKAIEYNCNKYTNKQLVDIYDFLTDIDYKLKSGKLELNSLDLFNYILYNVVCA